MLKSIRMHARSFSSSRTPASLDDAKYLMNTYARPSMILTHGDGCYVFDTNGRKYLDCTSGIAVTSIGHSHPKWVETVKDQCEKLTHTSNLYYTEPALALAKALVTNSRFDRAFFSNTGTEANEAALKFARKWAHVSGSSGKTEFVAFKNGFHGRTMGALSCTYKPQYREAFNPLIPTVSFAEYNNLESADTLIDKDKTCAVIVEPLQGEGGVQPATQEFMHGLRKICTERNVLLIVDEVQCGLGRTGRLWAHEAFDIKPDMMTLAKPLAGGLPIGAVLVTEEISSCVNPGDHGSTFAGGPLVCAAAKTVFDMISDPSFLDSVRQKGEYFVAQINEKLRKAYPELITEVRSLGGLLIGVQFSKPVKNLVEAAREQQGILFVNAGESVLRLAPPLTIEKEQIDDVVSALDKLIESGVMA